MLAQQIAVALIVPLCALGAVWGLLPNAARRALARAALRLPWPAPIAAHWQRGALAARSGCGGCDGCGQAGRTPAAAPRPRTIRIVSGAAGKRT